MPDVLVILRSSISPSERDAIARAAPSTQAISNRVFIAGTTEAGRAKLPSMAGVARVLIGGEQADNLPQLDDAETLFVRAWLSSRGEVKLRHGEGLDWDTPPMRPPDPTR